MFQFTAALPRNAATSTDVPLSTVHPLTHGFTICEPPNGAVAAFCIGVDESLVGNLSDCIFPD